MSLYGWLVNEVCSNFNLVIFIFVELMFREVPFVQIMEDVEFTRADLSDTIGYCRWARNLPYLEGKKSQQSWHQVSTVLVFQICIANILFQYLSIISSHSFRIHCTYMGGYTTKEVRGSTCHGTMYEEINVSGFKIHDASPGVLGRCFIEVVLDNFFYVNLSLLSVISKLTVPIFLLTSF